MNIWYEEYNYTNFASLEHECKLLETALLNLMNELDNTGELFQNIEHYLKESHSVLLPISAKECKTLLMKKNIIGEKNE